MAGPASNSSSDPAPAGEPIWRSLFEGKSAREILARVIEGDPLELVARCEQRVRSQALLIEVRRLHLRTAAHVARHAASYAGSPPIDVWIAERLRKGLSELLEEDEQAASLASLPEAPKDRRLLQLASSLGMDPAVLARGVVAFNRAPFGVRSAVQGLVIEGQSPSSWAAANGLSLDAARSALRRGLHVLGIRGDLDIDRLLAESEGGDEDDG